jgi:hypothetical protein
MKQLRISKRPPRRVNFLRIADSGLLGTSLAASSARMAFAFKRKKYRPPVEGPLRRLPGQSIRDERERLFDDKAVGYLLALAVAWLFALWQWIYKWTGGKPQPEVSTLFAILISVYCVYRMWRLRAEFRNLNLAERGERRVSEVLRQLRHRDYVTFDDLLLGDVNVDHVVVGPGGVFAIETKAYSVFGKGSAGIEANGTLQLSSNPAFKDPLKQARASAALVSAELKRWTQREIWVNPVLILPGWRIDPPKIETSVVVLNEETVSEFFKTRPEKLSTTEIREICSHLDRSARS